MDKLLDKTLTHTPSSIHTHPGRKKKHRKTNKTYKQTLKLELTTIQKDCIDTNGSRQIYTKVWKINKEWQIKCKDK